MPKVRFVARDNNTERVMIESLSLPALPRHAALPPMAYRGPERRSAAAAPSLVQWLLLTLDEIDYGVLLVIDETHVVHANHVARSEMDHEHPLQLLGTELRVRHTQDVAPVMDALGDAAKRKLRRM